MTKIAVRVLFLSVLGASTLAAQTTPTADFISRVPFLQRVLTGRNDVQTSALAFVPFVSTAIPVPAGFTVLLSVRFSAESLCDEPPTGALNWCEVRILIGGVEAEPVETSSGADFAFDSTAGATDGPGSWESHSMDRHRCFTNTTGVTQQVPVQVQWGVTTAGLVSFSLDDWSLVIQESQDCFDIPVPVSASTEESQVP